MNYSLAAKAVLETRSSLLAEFRSVGEDKSLTDAQKIERQARLSAEITQAEADARSYVEAAEREAEVRSLASGLPILGSAGRSENRAGDWLAQEIRTVTGASGAGAAFTPTQNASTFFDLLAPKSVFLASGVNLLTTDHDSLAIPRLLTDPTSAFVAEGDPISLSDPTGDTVTATPRKIAVLTSMTNEVIADSVPSLLEVHAQSILRSAALRFDLGCFEGSGAAPEIRGLKNVSGIQNLSAGTNGAALSDLDLIADALGALDTANADSENAVIVLPPRTWTALTKVKEATSGSNKALLQESYSSASGRIERRLLGRRVYTSSQLSITETQGTSNAASSIYVYDPAQLFAVMRTNAEIFLDPYSLSASDKTQVRLTMRADLVASNPAGVVRIAGVL